MNDPFGRLNRRSNRRRLLHCIAVKLLGLVPLGLPLVPQSVSAQTTPPIERPQRLLVVGDSLSAEYGLQRGTGWVSLLEQRIQAEGLGVSVINASVSGDTTAGGRSRLPALLTRHQPTHVVIELGGNDALRGLPLNLTEANLKAMVKAARDAKARVTLVGMQVPPNYGTAYTRDFAALFERVAQTEKVALVPFLLKGVADTPDTSRLFQPDRIHPNESAQPLMLANVWPVLGPQLRRR